MWIKWIRCSVHAASRADFHKTQQAWQALAGLPGFVLQVGGWNAHDDSEACILAVWAEKADYEFFMQHHHDRIADGSGQGETYNAIIVTFFDALWHTGDTADWPAAFAGAQYLHITQHTVYLEREAHFLDVQRTIWETEMGAAEMSAGLVSRTPPPGPLAYLTASAWLADRPIRQRQNAQVETDVVSRAEITVNLEPLWTVTHMRL